MSKKESAAARVYEDIKEQILSNAIAGGELISEGEIAARCAVSRTPVREAFLRLETEGWMRLYPKRGALVLPVSDGEAADVLEARTLLEIHAVRTVITDADRTAELVADLRANLDAHRAAAEAGDTAAFARRDAEFHELLVAAGGNSLLTGFYTGLRERQRRMTVSRVANNRVIVDRALDGHARLLAAVEARDAERFATALADHFTGVHATDARGVVGAPARAGS